MPDQLNGIVRTFLLYMSTNNTSNGWLIYNRSESDFPILHANNLLNFIAGNLTAGTQYFVRVGVR